MADPTTVAGLLRRFRASALTGLTTGDPVDSFADDLGGPALTQATSARQPTYRTGGGGGQPYLLFDGVDDYLRGSHSSPQAQPATLFVVMERIGTVAPVKIIDGVASSARHMLDRPTSPAGLRLFAGSSLSGGAGSLPDDVPTVVTGVFNGASSTVSVNGTVLATGAGGSHQGGGFTIAASTGASPGEFGNLKIYEVLYYTGALTDSERATVHTYVQDTYGITVADYTTGGVTGTGALTASPATLTGSGTLTVSGAGALTAGPATLSGSGVLTVTGGGEMTAAAATLTGSATLTVVGAAELTAQAATLSAAGLLTVNGTGTLTAPAATLSGAGTVIDPDAPPTITPPDRTLTVGADQRLLTVGADNRTLTA